MKCRSHHRLVTPPYPRTRQAGFARKLFPMESTERESRARERISGGGSGPSESLSYLWRA